MRLTLIVGGALLLALGGLALFQLHSATAAHNQLPLHTKLRLAQAVAPPAPADDVAQVGDAEVAPADNAAERPERLTGTGAATATPPAAGGTTVFQNAAGPGGPRAIQPSGGVLEARVGSVLDPFDELTSEDQQLEQEVQSLARQLADGGDEKQRAELKDKLAAALEKQFDAQQKLREQEVSQIEARVRKLRDLIHKRTDSRRKIIDNRLEQLLNDAEGLGWSSAAGAQSMHPRYPGGPLPTIQPVPTGNVFRLPASSLLRSPSAPASARP